VDAIDPNSDLGLAIAEAAQLYDANVQPDTYISGVTNAFENRAAPSYARDMSGILVAFDDYRASRCTTQKFAQWGALSDHQDRLSDMDARLRLQSDQQRAQGILAIANAIISQQQFQLQSNQFALAASIDVAKIVITANNDYMSLYMDYLIHNMTWDVTSFDYVWKGFGATAAFPVQNLPTHGGTLLAGITNSVSLAVQAGTAVGGKNGLLVGAVAGVANLLATGASLF
jgi:hypothetical protein